MVPICGPPLDFHSIHRGSLDGAIRMFESRQAEQVNSRLCRSHLLVASHTRRCLFSKGPRHQNAEGDQVGRGLHSASSASGFRNVLSRGNKLKGIGSYVL